MMTWVVCCQSHPPTFLSLDFPPFTGPRGLVLGSVVAGNEIGRGMSCGLVGVFVSPISIQANPVATSMVCVPMASYFSITYSSARSQFASISAPISPVLMSSLHPSGSVSTSTSWGCSPTSGSADTFF